ncbi:MULTISPECIES: DnaJ C-terminal domain-containing protein [unclassified Ensifer]|uniref:DnaJ C-terminal domain-containing protein n=1 Tax=unclassified Ensifer TaxID=2633371 RepID=UPI000812D9BA|nr:MULTISPECIES: DnaJ C-terminal domain-containing protein [unclassified Ensifer]OCP03947.1 molecular chaperone DnaJ [Ensifer sp. LC11]OCP04369.1 molecular chaperone DnaJ [Ensifer sp. LC13]OCP08525.1 molecular chaperone DnaJ [Ensifer sp. LC14]OCP30391.1 molecular chaperone DnaJ [Ensifer sp. LC499]
MTSPYETLGVSREATQKDIQSAYRKLAKKLHPDLNPGDKGAEDRFKAVSAAYALLSDEDKRGKYDRGEIDETGAETPPRQYYRDYATSGETAGRYESTHGFSDFGDSDDIFSSFFSRRTGGQRSQRGRDAHFSMEVGFLDAANGTKTQINLPGGGPALDLTIPPGTRDGQTLRLRGKGEAGFNGAPAGDALIDIRVRPHPLFSADGDDVRYDVPISLSEAVLGGKIRVPTIDGAVNVTIPPHSNTGKTLRLKGKGLHKSGGGHGDAYVSLKIALPQAPDPALSAFVESWEAGRAEDPRKGLGGHA